ncbi:MAG: hypothetical protein ISS53_01570 [Dehalococcoidia bacterium]|nr:hypothetical protein [Dehalococcoidia bacterium]
MLSISGGLGNLLEIVNGDKSEIVFTDALTGFFTGAAVDEIIYFFETIKRIRDRDKRRGVGFTARFAGET